MSRSRGGPEAAKHEAQGCKVGRYSRRLVGEGETPIPMDPPASVDELVNEARHLLRTEELGQYRLFEAEILRELERALPKILKDVADQTRSLADAQSSAAARLDRLRHVRRRFVVVATVLALPCLALALGYLIKSIWGVPPWLRLPSLLRGPSWFQELFVVGLSVVFTGLVLAMCRWTYTTSRAYQVHLAAQRELFSAETDLALARTSAVGLELRYAINRFADRADVLTFPSQAPALVELDSSEIVPSKSLHAARRFVEQHKASAVGVAGPRGVGKSTILRNLARSDSNVLGVYIPVPVKYDSKEFVRMLFEETVIQAKSLRVGFKATHELLHWRHSLRPRLIRAMSAAILLTAGMGSFVLGLQDPPPDVNALQIAGGVMLLVAFVLVLMEYTRLLERTSVRRRVGGSFSEADEILNVAIEQLRWTREVSMRPRRTAHRNRRSSAVMQRWLRNTVGS
jgi:hypothetical protein